MYESFLFCHDFFDTDDGNFPSFQLSVIINAPDEEYHFQPRLFSKVHFFWCFFAIVAMVKFCRPL